MKQVPPLRATLLAVAIAAALAGCATTSGPNQTVFYGTGNSYRQNGLQITELQGGSLGQGVSRMTIRGKDDIAAIDKLIQFYNRKAVESVAAKDAEQFAVAWSLSKKLTAARMEQELASQAFINDLIKQGNGQASLPGGARVYLPNSLYAENTATAPAAAPESIKKRQLRKTAPGKRSAVDELMNTIASLELPTQPLGEQSGVKVAALGNLAGLLNGVATGAASATNAQPRMTAGVIENMKVGSAYAVADSLGNKYIVEKSSDGLVLHNPDGAATKVDLKQMNFMPIWEKPEAYRYNAAKIYQNIESHLRDEMDKSASLTHGYLVSPPNRFVVRGSLDGYLNTDGTYSAVEIPQSRAAYQSDRAYKTAVDHASKESLEEDPIYKDFNSNCNGSAWRTYHGETLEYVTYSCFNRAKVVAYSRTFVVSNSMKAQSWDSMLKDQSFKDSLKNAHNLGKLAEALGGFVPLVGNLDAGMRCAGLDSAIYSYANRYFSQSVSADVRKFVTYSPEADTPSAMNTALDCAQGVAGIASIGSGLSKAAKLANIEGMVTTPVYQNAMDLMGMLDNKVLYGKDTAAEILDSSRKFSSPAAAFLAKVFYDKVQQFNNFSGAADAISTAVQG
jgi:hypothetical protein